MIRPLRRRHAWLAPALLALAAPAGLIAGVLARPDAPLAAGLPPGVAADPGPPSGSVEQGVLDAGGTSVRISVWGAGPERLLELAPARDLERPDVLVYWTADVARGATTPPADAVLLGALAGAQARRFALPAGVRTGGGVLLYSLGHRAALGAAALPGE